MNCPRCGKEKSYHAKLCGNCFIAVGGSKNYTNGQPPVEVSCPSVFSVDPPIENSFDMYYEDNGKWTRIVE